MPVLTTPNDSATLRQLMDTSAAAIESHDQQISVLTAKITEKQDTAEKLEMSLLEDAAHSSELEAQLRELHSRFKQAQVSAGVAVGTNAEASQSAHVASLGAQIETLQQQIETHAKEHKKLEHVTRKQQLELQQQTDKDEIDLSALRENRRMLVQTHQEHHEMLGEALYNEVAARVSDMLAHREQLEDDLAGVALELAIIEKDIDAHLRDWPSLSRKAKREVIPVKAPELLPIVKVLKAQVAYLQTLSDYGKAIEATPHTNPNRTRIVQTLQVPVQLVDLALQGNKETCQRWQSEVNEVLTIVERQERDRQARREWW